MQIRQAMDADLPVLLELVRRIVPMMRATGNLQWDETYPNAKVFGRDIELGELWLAETEITIVGVAAITRDQVPEYAQIGWDLQEPAFAIHRLAVDPAVRGLGIATSLMQQAEVVAGKQGIAVLRVDTSIENAATQRLFPKLGYVFAGEIALDFRPGLRVLCYEKRLDRA